MAEPRMETVTCPGCGETSPYATWPCINPAMHSEQVQLLLTQRLFVFTCPHCGACCRVEYPVLYRDFDRRFMLWFAPPDVAADGEQEPLWLGKVLKPEERQQYTLRAVSSSEALKEKILLFDAGLDDRVMEIVKQFVLRGVRQRVPDAQAEALRFFADADGGWHMQLTQPPGGSVSFEREVYDRVAETLLPMLENAPPPRMVDAAWAAGFVTEE